ncbi:helix-turn-helix domain-containing protein [Paenibacillus rhizophilus]|uniref:helix-turn-helix domain-containing protein n=1 Tax=Paenibacillus rhizophilus TaxID=1850366 RepID=UPI0016398B27|nr:helix-turn-helix transcriptional regulator [Paenibacillus rhizophilus]
MNNVEFGKYLRDKRKERKLTIRQLDTYSGVSHSYISQVERGNRGVPSPDILQKLSKPLGVDYDELMVRAGYIEDVKDKFPKDLQPIVDDTFIDLVNDMVEETFKYEDFNEEDRNKLGLTTKKSFEDYINSLNLFEKIEMLKEFMGDNDDVIKTNKQFFDFLNAFSGDAKVSIDLSDENLINEVELYYDGMKLTKEEKIEFFAIARGVISARRELKEKN